MDLLSLLLTELHATSLLTHELRYYSLPLPRDLAQASDGIELEDNWRALTQCGIHKHPTYPCLHSSFSQQNELPPEGGPARNLWGGPHLGV